MTGTVYTHALWRVRSGNEDAFESQWSELANVFSRLAQKPLWETLIRSKELTNVYYSFGPWQSEEDVAAMRRAPEAQAAFRELAALCEESTPHMYTLVRHIVP